MRAAERQCPMDSRGEVARGSSNGRGDCGPCDPSALSGSRVGRAVEAGERRLGSSVNAARFRCYLTNGRRTLK
jgi:hypothetical protein